MPIIDPYTQLILAHHQESTGNLPAAEKTLREILAAYPLHAEALHLLATILQDPHRSAEALQIVEKAAAAAPIDAAIHNTLAAFLANYGQHERAATIWRRLHEINPKVA